MNHVNNAASATTAPALTFPADDVLALMTGDSADNGVWHNLTVSEVTVGLLFARRTAREAVKITAVVVEQICEQQLCWIAANDRPMVKRLAIAIRGLVERGNRTEIRHAADLLEELYEPYNTDAQPLISRLLIVMLSIAASPTRLCDFGIDLVRDLTRGMSETQRDLVALIREHIAALALKNGEA